MRAEQDDHPGGAASERPQRRGRTFLLLVLALIIVSGGAWAWMTYGKRLNAMLVGRGTVSGNVPLVRADSAPSKVRPSDPGGMEVPDRDKLVYERLQGGEEGKRVERLLPGAEQPRIPPRSAHQPAPQVQERLPKVPTEQQVRAAVKPEPLNLAPGPAATPTPEDSAPRSEETAPPPSPPEPKTPEPKAEDSQALQPQAPKSPPPPPKAAEPQQSARAEAPAQGPAAASSAEKAQAPSGYLIQIAAVREPERAEIEWNRLQRQHGEALGGLKLFVVRADLGDKGVFWRLRAGPFADEAAAKSRCADLAKRKVGCMTVKAGG
ncbi:MAG: hypothetical protein FJX42_00785 [Alphaproteobacteria bacterium]|nr:hypothetical protein [Alphaproteobacteria bacterium]